MACVLFAGCERGPTAAGPASGAVVAHSATTLDVALCDPAEAAFPGGSTNPWFPLAVGDQWSYEGEEDGEPVRVVITVLDMFRTIEGVETFVVEEREWEGEGAEEELIEVSWNYFAEADDGTVCYFGEDVDEYEDGDIVHEGAWCADEPGRAPGIMMPADPRPGQTFQMEVAPGVAEDEGKIVGVGPVTVPAGTFLETIRLREYNPLDGEKGYKVFAMGVGMIVDEVLELVAYAHGAGAPAGPIPTDQTCGI